MQNRKVADTKRVFTYQIQKDVAGSFDGQLRSRFWCLKTERKLYSCFVLYLHLSWTIYKNSKGKVRQRTLPFRSLRSGSVAIGFGYEEITL